MTILFVQIEPWDKVLEVSQMAGGKPINPNEFKIGDSVIIKTESGTDLAKIVKIEDREIAQTEAADADEKKKEFCILVRKANENDLQKIAKRSAQKKETIDICEKLIKKHNLPMKLIDMHFSYDGGRITFAFSAGSKIDFRELVKELTKKFHKSIRMHQVGARQEVEYGGDIGPCGQPLCCRSFLKKLGNISTELIFDQQLAHRGIDRLSGICGKLKCCLKFEEELYKELMEKLPSVGSVVKTTKGEGKVKDWRILKQTVMVEIDKDTVIEIPITEIEK